MLKWQQSDRGASALTIAITMVVIMGMAAIAIDAAGFGFNERRQDQTGADTAVMAGAVEFVVGGSQQSAVDEILKFVDINVRSTPPGDWVACNDDGSLIVTAADLGLSPATDCISFETFNRVRVRVPDQEIETSFGKVIGFSSLTTNAFAEASLEQFPGIGQPPPFAVLSGNGGGDVVCLRTNASGNPPLQMKGNGPDAVATRGTDPVADADPCDDSVYPVDSETFGLLDPYAYFDDDGSISCKKNVNHYFIAAGIDHPIGAYLIKYGSGWSIGDPEVQEGEGCGGSPKNPVSGPDTMPVRTGLDAQELRCGLLTTNGPLNCSSTVPGPPGTSLSSPARLHQGLVQTTYEFVGEKMDNSALWQFFTTDGSGVAFTSAPASCDSFAAAINSNFTLAVWDYYDKRDALLTCLNDWDPMLHGQLFADNLWDSSRFVFLPFLAESTLDSMMPPPIGPSPCPVPGGECVHIDDFVPVWYQTLYTQEPNGACVDAAGGWGLHHAGQQNSCGKNNGKVARLNSIVLDCGMLPRELCQARPGTPGGTVAPGLELTR